MSNSKPWFVGAPMSGFYDYRSVATHELGHGAGIYHSSISSAVMYKSINSGTLKRTLTTDDKTAIKARYGTKPTSFSTNSIQNNTLSATNIDNITDGTIYIVSSFFENMSLYDLKNDSNLIIKGKVKEIFPSKWNTVDGNEPQNIEELRKPHIPVMNESHPLEKFTIYTDVMIAVDDVYKGTIKENDVRVRLNGGQCGRYNVLVQDNPIIEEGEEVILYLTNDEQPLTKVGLDHYVIMGGKMGKFNLTSDGLAQRGDDNPIYTNDLIDSIKNNKTVQIEKL